MMRIAIAMMPITWALFPFPGFAVPLQQFALMRSNGKEKDTSMSVNADGASAALGGKGAEEPGPANVASFNDGADYTPPSAKESEKDNDAKYAINTLQEKLDGESPIEELEKQMDEAAKKRGFRNCR